MMNLVPGDKIYCKKMTVTIQEIFYQSFDENAQAWDVEFTDASGKYRRWKQHLDGGEVIGRPRTQP